LGAKAFQKSHDNPVQKPELTKFYASSFFFFQVWNKQKSKLHQAVK
jgi:hypothetical protein